MATVSPLPRTNRITLSFSTAGPFEVGFRLFDTEALDVYVDGLPRTDWTLAATFQNGFSDSATITFTAPLANGAVIQIDGALIPAREDDYINGPGLTALMNIELARVWASLSEVNRLARTAVRGFDDQDPVEGISAAAFAGLETALDDAEAAALAAAASAAAALASQTSAAANAALLGVWRGAWVTATSYAIGDRVSNAGSSYYALSAHTSAALFSTDLSGGKWGVLAEKGAAGTGTGDVLAANNGSDFANKPTTLANLGGQPVNANLTAESGLTGAADRLSYYTGVGAKALTVLSAFARTILDDANDGAVRTTLGLGALAVLNQITISDLAAALLVTEAEGIIANDNDTTVPSSAAVKDLVDASKWVFIGSQAITNDATGLYTGLGGYRDIGLLVVGSTSTINGNRQVRVGTSGGILSTNIYRWAQGALTNRLRMNDGSSSARSFYLEILGFNTTEAVKRLKANGSFNSGDAPVAIESALAFDRLQVTDEGGVNNINGGMMYLWGRI
jgi:hypothetical protein